MSAIVGLLNFDRKHPVSVENGNKMMETLQEFPSDDIRTFCKENIFLGCHAQWITPESVDEILPFYDYDRQLAITADAIIDNRSELFDKLGVKKDFRERMPDSQLILLAYEKWGEDSPKHLVGDFAFMIWDEKHQQLFGARDFSGSRTLYYHHDQNIFCFSTTIKPLFTQQHIKKQLNEQWLAEYLAIPDMFNSVDIHTTIYKNVNQVPPSHSIIINKDRIDFTRYCSFSSIKKLNLKSDTEYVEAFDTLFQRAIKDRLRTYKNIGAHLSGGLDSGSVVAFAAKILEKESKPLHSFSYVPLPSFKDWTPKSRIADERPFINETVKYVGNIKNQYLSFDNRSPFNEIDNWINLIEMPYKFFINSYWIRGIHEKAHEMDIKILLSGARGNYTISWGNTLDYYAFLLKRFNWIRLFKELNKHSEQSGIGRKRLITLISKKAFPKHSNNTRFPTLINPNFANRTNVYDRLQSNGIDIKGQRIPDTFEARNRQFDQLFYWGNGVSGTNLSLRYALWNRDPTNDLRIVKFCLSLPNSQFVQNGMDRHLIRRATENKLPDSVRLNFRQRGVQGADGISRMANQWNNILNELNELSTDNHMAQYFNMDTLKKQITCFPKYKSPENLFNPDFKILMRSLIVYRFIKICL